jgi:hypothetical protein
MQRLGPHVRYAGGISVIFLGPRAPKPDSATCLLLLFLPGEQYLLLLFVS